MVVSEGPDREHLLDVEELVVHFPARQGRVVHAVDGISFHVDEGETLALVGESGSGKTTTGLAVLRRQQPSSGRVIFDGRDITLLGQKELRAIRRDIQIVFQDPFSSLTPTMRVEELVAEPLIVHGVASRGKALTQRVGELLEMCGLPRSAMSRYPAAFSGGERQRIAIARALSLGPKLIVADEVVSALDVSIQAQIINLLVSLQTEHKLSYLFISHDLAVVRQLAHRVVVMYAGKIMEVGDVDAIFDRPMHPYTKALLSAAPLPDPAVERTRERITLSGEPPSITDPPQGCRFNTRCPLAVERCFAEAPPLDQRAQERQVACWVA